MLEVLHYASRAEIRSVIANKKQGRRNRPLRSQSGADKSDGGNTPPVGNDGQDPSGEIIKSRQQGITTLCHAIMLWRMMAKPHSNILIMANSQKNLEQHHFKDFVKMAEHFGKEMLCPVGNAIAKSFEFFSSHAVGGWANTRGACAGLRSRRYI